MRWLPCTATATAAAAAACAPLPPPTLPACLACRSRWEGMWTKDGGLKPGQVRRRCRPLVQQLCLS